MSLGSNTLGAAPLAAAGDGGSSQTTTEPKTLNTAHPLYSSIVRALTPDVTVSNLVAIAGGSDLTAQTDNYVSASEVATWSAVQGIARNSTNWFAIDTAEIRRYNLVNGLLTTNSSPFASLPVGLSHCGDGFADEDYLYVPVSNYSAGSATLKGVALYDASDLTYDSYINMDSESDLNASGCCLDSTGTEILVTSYYATAGSDQRNTDIYRYNASTGAYISTYTLDTASVGIQGITYHEDKDAYYISSHNPTGTLNKVYWYNSDFELQAILRPTGNDNIEAEGLAYYDGELFWNRVSQSPELIDLDFMCLDGADSTQPQFLDASLLSDDCTILMNLRVTRLFNYNSLFDNNSTANDWEAWVYSTGELAFRVNASARTSYNSLSDATDYILAFTWSKSGSNVTCKVGVDGVYGTASTSATWVTPPTAGLYLGGINASNDEGENVYKDIIVFDKVLSDAELLDASDNFHNFHTETATPTIVADDSSHAHTSDNLTLTAHSQISIDDSVHAHASDNLTLTSGASLSINDSTHSSTADSLTLTAHSPVSVNDSSHAHAADSPNLTAHSVVVISKSSHAHSSDNLTVSYTASGSLAVADSQHGHTAEILTLTAHSPISTNESTHSHTSDNLTVGYTAPSYTADINDSTHAHSADAPTVLSNNVVSINDALHAHTADNVAVLSDGSSIPINNATHAHSADSCNVYELWREVSDSDTEWTEISNSNTVWTEQADTSSTWTKIA